MPFGLMNAGATFQRKVDRAVADLEAAFAYVDNMDVASRNAEEHAVHLHPPQGAQAGHQRGEVRLRGVQHPVPGPPPLG